MQDHHQLNGKEVAPHTPRVGDRVRIERDEHRYPPKGSWRQFSGRVGTVVEINADRKRPYLTEFGVVFGKVWPRVDGRGRFAWASGEPVTWFKVYELKFLPAGRAPSGHAKALPTTSAVVTTDRQLAGALR